MSSKSRIFRAINEITHEDMLEKSCLMNLGSILPGSFRPMKIYENELLVDVKNKFESCFDIKNCFDNIEKSNVSKDKWKDIFKFGYVNVPDEYDGLGITNRENIYFLEKLGMYDLGLANSFNSQIAFIKVMNKFGRSVIKPQYLKGLGSGDLIGSLCFNEPSYDNSNYSEARLKYDECDNFSLNGQKECILNGNISNIFIIFAKMLNQYKLADADIPILLPILNGIKIGDRKNTTGLDNSSYVDIHFNSVKIPNDINFKNIFSKNKYEDSINIIRYYYNYYNYLNAISLLSVMKRLLKNTFDHVLTREQFGNPLIEIDDVKLKIARMASFTYNTETMIHYTSQFLHSVNPSVTMFCSILRVYSIESAWKLLDEAMQLFGGRSYMTNNIFNNLFKDILTLRSIDGSNIFYRQLAISQGFRKNEYIKPSSKLHIGYEEFYYFAYIRKFRHISKNKKTELLHKSRQYLFDVLVTSYVQALLEERKKHGSRNNNSLRNDLESYYREMNAPSFKDVGLKNTYRRICEEITLYDGFLPCLDELYY